MYILIKFGVSPHTSNLEEADDGDAEEEGEYSAQRTDQGTPGLK